MPHETTLIPTIVMGLLLAFVGGFLASKVKLPPLVAASRSGRLRQGSLPTQSSLPSLQKSASSC